MIEDNELWEKNVLLELELTTVRAHAEACAAALELLQAEYAELRDRHRNLNLRLGRDNHAY